MTQVQYYWYCSLQFLSDRPISCTQSPHIPSRKIPYEYFKSGGLGWWSGVVVSALVSINKVNLRRAQLVLRWVQFPVPDIYFGM